MYAFPIFSHTCQTNFLSGWRCATVSCGADIILQAHVVPDRGAGCARSSRSWCKQWREVPDGRINDGSWQTTALPSWKAYIKARSLAGQATWCPTTLWVCGREVLAAVSPPQSTGIQWMHQPPAHWIDNVEYRRFQHYVENLAVVNDAAERAVKDVTDFAEYSQDPNRCENVIKVVNSHRELFDVAHLIKDEIGNI